MQLQNNSGNVPGAMFFAAYVGSSMNPTLREPEIMEIRPYDGRPLRIGDVVFFCHRRLISRSSTALSM